MGRIRYYNIRISEFELTKYFLRNRQNYSNDPQIELIVFEMIKKFTNGSYL